LNLRRLYLFIFVVYLIFTVEVIEKGLVAERIVELDEGIVAHSFHYVVESLVDFELFGFVKVYFYVGFFVYVFSGDQLLFEITFFVTQVVF